MKIAHTTLLDAVDAALNHDSAAIDMQGIYAYALQVIYDGTPSGNIQVQGSNDEILPGNTQPVNWANIGLPIPAALVHMENFSGNNAPGYRWMRVQFAEDGGTGAVTVKYFGKGV